MNDDNPSRPGGMNATRSWFANSRHYTDRVYQLNVKLTGEANTTLREIANKEHLMLYEAVEKVIAFYREHHPRGDRG